RGHPHIYSTQHATAAALRSAGARGWSSVGPLLQVLSSRLVSSRLMLETALVVLSAVVTEPPESAAVTTRQYLDGGRAITAEVTAVVLNDLAHVSPSARRLTSAVLAGALFPSIVIV